MNILIPDSWLRDFLKTDARAEDVARALSLCSLSVDKLETITDGDTIYHIEVPPNRYDCLSVLGVAHEATAALPRFGHPATLKGLTGTPRKGASSPDEVAPLPSPKKAKLSLQIQIDQNLCPHFAAIVMDQVEIKPSPIIIRQRLEKAGVRALNNVIDITNYLMLETGQPMHAFDYDNLSPIAPPADSSTPPRKNPSGLRRQPEGLGNWRGFSSAGPRITKKMLLRASRAGEWLVTLDGVKRQLPTGSIVIEDGEKLIDLCGIMGGENSAINEKTQHVILFAQIYDPIHVRKTSMALPLRTEAAQRFEKGLDPEAVLPTLYQSIRMLQENAGATIASPLYNLRQKLFNPHQVSLRLEKLHQYLGVTLQEKEVVAIFSSLGFQSTIPASSSTTHHLPATIQFSVPSWRDKDITIEEDLIEEVARVYGYHNLPTTLPVGEPAKAQPEPRFAYEHRLKYLLKDLGFTEVYTSSLVSKELAGDWGALPLLNPLGPETAYLKVDSLPIVIETAKENLKFFDKISLFEITNTYQKIEGQTLPKERGFLVVVISSNEDQEKIFLRIKGLVERIFKEFGVVEVAFKDASSFSVGKESLLNQNLSCIIWPTKEIKSGKIFGKVGQLSKDVRLWSFTLHLEALWELAKPQTAFTPSPKHPPLIEEISFYLTQKTTYAAAVETIKAAGGEVLQQAELADYYTDETLQKKGQKSLTLKLTFADRKKTLESRELQPVREKIIKALQERLGATVRAKIN